ncbi:MAG: DUF401 family protein, partial [Candidatus Wallbacteria bacterium]|nr:DUF401 family protein [Candidatus Wallbacteria bacterium]
LFSASLLTACLYLTGPPEIFSAMLETTMDIRVWELFAAIYFILLLSRVFTELKIFPPVFALLNRSIRDKRLIVPIFPAIIGLLPMLGGAVFSAPFVEEASKGLNLGKDQKAFLNYWFRHVWEYFFPLYSGVIMLVKIVDVPLWNIVRSQWYMSLCAIVFGLGYLFHFVRGIPPEESAQDVSPGWNAITTAFFPFLVILFGLFFKGLSFAVLIFLASVPYSVIMCRKRRVSFHRIAFAAFSPGMLLLIVSVFFFKRMIETVGMAGEFQSCAILAGINVDALLFLLPFLMGLITGVTNAYVGICFPLLLPFMVPGGTVDYSRVLFAYTSGLCGVLLSPVHLCLILTCEFFDSRLARVYPTVISGCIIMLGVSLCRILF